MRAVAQAWPQLGSHVRALWLGSDAAAGAVVKQIEFPFCQHKLYHFFISVPLKIWVASVWRLPCPQQVNKCQLK